MQAKDVLLQPEIVEILKESASLNTKTHGGRIPRGVLHGLVSGDTGKIFLAKADWQAKLKCHYFLLSLVRLC